MGLYSGGFIIGRIFAAEIWHPQIWRGGGGYFQEGLFLEWLIIRILRSLADFILQKFLEDVSTDHICQAWYINNG